eukprot:2662887-Rhodomonas_salina.2
MSVRGIAVPKAQWGHYLSNLGSPSLHAAAAKARGSCLEQHTGDQRQTSHRECIAPKVGCYPTFPIAQEASTTPLFPPIRCPQK